MATSDIPAARRVCVIDLGSNSVLCLVLERGGRALRDEARVTRLGEGVFPAGRLAPAARERTLAAVREMARAARAEGAERVVAIGTEALRRAADSASFVDELCRAGLVDEAAVLTGEEEARLALEGVAPARGALTSIDVAGGSTVVARRDAGGRIEAVSLPLGSVRLSERLVRAHPIPPGALEALRAVARTELRSAALPPADPATVVALAGTATTLAALEMRLEVWDAERVEGVRMPRGALGRWIARLARLSVEERRALPGMESGRADVLPAGLVILDELLGALGASAFEVSARGARWGVARRLLARVPGVW
jgi:exopolyphosphatase/guanosine-5'-triphosphate,3'-diphosphate pyrophosphatase